MKELLPIVVCMAMCRGNQRLYGKTIRCLSDNVAVEARNKGRVSARE